MYTVCTINMGRFSFFSMLILLSILVTKIAFVSTWPTDLGCYTYPTSSDVFPAQLHLQQGWPRDDVTIEICLKECRNLAYRFAAVRNEYECYCGQYFVNGSSSNTCSSTCRGNSRQICGGTDAVNVYTVCRNGTYKGFGNTCSGTCRCKIKDPPCHPGTGRCPNDQCQELFTGTTCTRCIPGMYGTDCSSQCGQCVDETCDLNDGECSNSGCKTGYFGRNCNMKCGNCANDICNRDDGVCSNECENTYHGQKCDKKCGHCKGSSCSIADGICEYGCEDGFTTPTCRCGHCKVGTTCDRDTEECIEGCRDGYYGIKCTLKCGYCLDDTCDYEYGTCHRNCKPGYHGKTCYEKCGKCKAVHNACEKETGQCSEGCEDGFTGHLCKHECRNDDQGINCASFCVNCKNGCNNENGRCKAGGCKAAFAGEYCDTKTDTDSSLSTKEIVMATFLVITCLIILLLLVTVVLLKNKNKFSMLQKNDPDHVYANEQITENDHLQGVITHESRRETVGGPYEEIAQTNSGNSQEGNRERQGDGSYQELTISNGPGSYANVGSHHDTGPYQELQTTGGSVSYENTRV